MGNTLFIYLIVALEELIPINTIIWKIINHLSGPKMDFQYIKMKLSIIWF